MKSTIIKLMFLFLAFSITINAQEDTTRSLKWYSMFSNLPSDMSIFYSVTFTKEKIPTYIGIASLTAGLILTDNMTWKSSDKWYRESSKVKNISDDIVSFGDGRSQFGLSALFAAYGLLAKDDHALRVGSEITEAVLASGAVVQVLKHLTGRESPESLTKPGGAWRFFPNQKKYHKHVSAYDAYPSGHLTTTLATVVVIAENYPNWKWVRPVGYTLAGLLSVSMVNNGIHWYGDYPLAIFLGYTFGKIIAHPDRELKESKGGSIEVYPLVINKSIGLSLNYAF